MKFFLTAPVSTLLIFVTSHALHFYKEKDVNCCLLRDKKNTSLQISVL